ncbi:hypothetical protein V6N13_112146 [Hibiscus sabdariffa]|uniref:Uncharacterized protein n=1 Tax=Hibiscus sabdariffa TaxID=183260 RepID=A0ABR2TMW3_9ROSI
MRKSDQWKTMGIKILEKWLLLRQQQKPSKVVKVASIGLAQLHCAISIANTSPTPPEPGRILNVKTQQHLLLMRWEWDHTIQYNHNSKRISRNKDILTMADLI